MHVLVMASQKGGSGKTTLSGHLAVEGEQAGLGPVSLIDTDPQGSLSQWWNAREAQTPHFANVQLAELGDALDHLRQAGIKLVVIDTPPAVTESISRVVAHADLVVVPTRPSPHDLRAIGATVDIAEYHQKPVVFVLNAATARARITGEAAVALSQHGTVAPVTLHHRVDFAASMVDGRTVGEVVPKSPSAREMHDLWLYIQNRLSRLKQAPEIAAEDTRRFAVASLSPLDAESLRRRTGTGDSRNTRLFRTGAPFRRRPARGGGEFRRAGTPDRHIRPPRNGSCDPLRQIGLLKMRKFASMTANLVAREGGSPPLGRERAGERFEPKLTADPERPRKLFVPLSHEEHERLTIAAAKTKSTPHQVVHAALEHYFHKLAADAQCQCIADVCTRGCAAN